MRDYGKGQRDPSSHRTPEQIREMDRGYNHEPVHIRGRSQRNQARTIMRRAVGAAAIRGKDIDHKKMVKDGGSNSRENLRVQSEHKNRGWRRDA